MGRSARAARVFVAPGDPFPPQEPGAEVGDTHFGPAIPPEVMAKYPHRWVLLRREGDKTIVIKDADDLESLFSGIERREGDVSAFVRASDRSYA